jgi:hypothetical protein
VSEWFFFRLVFFSDIQQTVTVRTSTKKTKKNQSNRWCLYIYTIKNRRGRKKTGIETSIRIKKQTNSAILSFFFPPLMFIITRSRFEKTKMNLIYSSPSESLSSSSSSPSSSSIRRSPLLLLVLLLFVEFALAVVNVW